ncbi:MAG: glycosyltransferase family 4 protein [Chitinispirillaceae bacterium]|nr:glycosyltransferase family 4 protein [Chitinispirillaceae bacterium]
MFVSQTALGTSTTNRYVQMCTYLAEAGYRVTLFFIGKGKAAQDRLLRYPAAIGPVIVRHTTPVPAFILKHPNVLTSGLAALFLFFTCIPRLLIAFFRHNVVVLGKPLPLGAVAVFFCSALVHRPVVLDTDDWEGVGGFATLKQGGNAFAKAVITYFEEWVPTRCAAVVSVSRLLSDRIRRSGVAESNIFYVPNGADLVKFNPGIDGEPVRTQLGVSGKTVIGYLGTFKPGGANWQFMLDAFHAVCLAKQSVALVIIGFGEQLDNAREYAQRLGIDSRVLFTGQISHDEVPRYLSAADILIFPYSSEYPDTYLNAGRSSLKLYEYMALGKPVVASDIGELHESLKEGGGVLVLGNSPLEFGRKICELIDDKETMRRFGAESRRRAENRYNYESLAKEFAKAVEHAINGKKQYC